MEVNVESCDSLSGDEEPKLKYERLGNDVGSIVAADAVSCVCVHEKLVVVGTLWGRVHVLDHAGYAVGGGGAGQAAGAHAVAVNALSVDTAGEWVGSCADDGRVRVASLAADDAPLTLTLPRPVKAIALHPNYSSERCFLTGDDRVSLHERRFLGGVRSTTICTVDGTVSALAWGGRFAAAAGGGGVRVIDTKHRVSLGLVQWEKALLEQSRCSLLWSDKDTLMIGWGDTLRICRVRRRLAVELLTRDATEYLVDPVYTFRTDYIISGLGPLEQQLVLLGAPKEGDREEGKAPRPVLTVNDYKDCDFGEVSTDTLNIREYERLTPLDYRLETLPGESRYFIVSPKDIVVASPCSPDDRVAWLVDRARWQRALQVLEENNGRTARHTLADVGARYADWLRARGEHAACAALVARVCRTDTKLWEREVEAFAAVNQLRAISPYVPRDPDHALPPRVYELILYEYLKVDPAGFLALVREWSPRLYRTGVIIKEVLEHLLTTQVDNHLYLEALALLYCHQNKYDKALNAYLKIQHKAVFPLITKHNMYDVIHDKILDLMTLDCDRAISVLLEKSSVPVEVVMKQLERQEHEQLLLKYLDAYSRVEPSGVYHGRLVQLYAKYNRDKLLPFLRGSDCYPIQAALDVCQQAGLHEEGVFLLARIGNTREALHIIIHQLHDIAQAITFCQEHDDRELWTDLIAHSVQRPDCVTSLLRRVGGYLDPRLLLQHIPSNQHIPELQDALAKMMGDYSLQLSVQAACRAITLRNYFELHARLVGSCRRGVRVGDEARCGTCRQRLLARDLTAGPLLVRACRHHYHARCLPHDQPCVLCADTTNTNLT